MRALRVAVLVGCAVWMGACAAKHEPVVAQQPEPTTSPSEVAPTHPIELHHVEAPVAQAPAPASTPAPTQAPTPAPAWVEALPGIRVCRELHALEFDGTVPIDVHGKAPRVFLEVLVCNKNTREHEALVVTGVQPSQVHAAMLMLGMTPGAPGAWRFEHAVLESTPPNGPGVRVQVRWERNGAAVTDDIASWVVNLKGGQRLSERPDERLVFAGSQFRRGKGADEPDVYAADPDGTLVGLTAFGSETIAWSGMYHPDSAFEQPQWIADPARVPAMGTKVTVVISAL